jgi:hypothetical protein
MFLHSSFIIHPSAFPVQGWLEAIHHSSFNLLHSLGAVNRGPAPAQSRFQPFRISAFQLFSFSAFVLWVPFLLSAFPISAFPVLTGAVA